MNPETPSDNPYELHQQDIWDDKERLLYYSVAFSAVFNGIIRKSEVTSPFELREELEIHGSSTERLDDDNINTRDTGLGVRAIEPESMTPRLMGESSFRRRAREYTSDLTNATLDSKGRIADENLRHTLVDEHYGLAINIARTYRNRGVTDDDLIQTALQGLVGAANRFDPLRGIEFSKFAGVTIEGMLNVYLRDHRYVIRMPRSFYELRGPIQDAVNVLEQTGNAVNPSSIAAYMRNAGHTTIDEQTIADILFNATARTVSIDNEPTISSDGLRSGYDLEESLIPKLFTDEIFEHLNNVYPSKRDIVNILKMYHGIHPYKPHSQEVIAGEIGISQMQVSRLIDKAYKEIRRHTNFES